MSSAQHLAKFQLKAVEVTAGQFQVIEQGLLWELTKLDQKDKLLPDSRIESLEAKPLFEVFPAKYHLAVTFENRTVEIQSVQLDAGKIVDELIIFQQGDAQAGDYHIDPAEVNLDSEHVRRQLERDGQRKFGVAVEGLRSPDVAAAIQNMGGQLMDMGMGVQAHPVLSQSAQFDGIAAKLTQDASQNQHAAEAQIQPDLKPGAQPNAAPGMRGPTPNPYG